MKKFHFSGGLSLLLATIIWSTSFVVLKKTLDDIPVLWTLSARFLIASVIIAAVSWRELKKIDKSHIKYGLLMGIALFTAYVLQTYGLAMTTPGKNAFLTAIYCVIVPFLYWIISKRKPNAYNITAAFMCMVGVGLASLTGDLTIGIGDGLTLICGLFYAIHIIITARGTEGRSVISLTFLQLLTAGILSFFSALIFEPFPSELPSGSALSLIYLSVMCTAVTFFLQTYGQKHTTPSRAAIILTTESVLGTIFSAILGYENLSVRSVAGFIIIFLAIIISETKLDFIKNGISRIKS